MQKTTNSQDSSYYSIRDIGIYVLLTSGLLIALFFTTNHLSQQPKYLPNDSALISRDWVVITDREQLFTFDLPNNWAWTERDEPSFIDVLNKNIGIETAVSLFRRIDPETKLKIISISEPSHDHSPFLFVAQSTRMKQLMPTELAAAISQNVSGLQQIEINNHPGGQQSVEFTLDHSIYNETWECFYQYRNNETAGFILASCGSNNDLGAIRQDLTIIHDSFQLLYR